MILKRATLFLGLFSFVLGNAQQLKHTIEKGENLYSLSKKYGVTLDEIISLNPALEKATLSIHQVVLIPNKNHTSTNKSVHVVQSGDNLFKLSKQYNVSLDQLTLANPQLKNNRLSIGQEINLPTGNVAKTTVADTKAKEIVANKVETNKVDESLYINHVIKAKETKYSIAKFYGISVAELDKHNPGLEKKIIVGDMLKIVGATKNNKPIVANLSSSEVNLATAATSNKSYNNITKDFSGSKANFLIKKATEYLGVRYRGGGTDANGFDCSGLMFTTFKSIDMILPRSSADMANNAGYRIDRSQAKPGDLIFFSTVGRGVSHVGMITDVTADDIKFIHSSTSNGVVISSMNDKYYARNFVQINRVLVN